MQTHERASMAKITKDIKTCSLRQNTDDLSDITYSKNKSKLYTPRFVSFLFSYRNN